MLIAVLGDCLLDISVRPHGPMRAGGDTPARIRIGSGGQGANVAVRLARRGASVRLVAAMADDLGARLLREALDRDAVNLATLSASSTGSVVALLDAAGERTMVSDRAALDATTLPELLEDADWVHVSGYALRDAAAELVSAALAALPITARVSVGGGSIPPHAEVAAAFLGHLQRAQVELLVVSRGEAAALSNGDADPSALATYLAQWLGAAVIVTDGAAGSVAAARFLDAPIIVEALEPDVPVVDATGAGDAYAAALIDDLAHLGTWPPTADALRLAMRAGSRLGGLVARVDGAQGRVEGEAAPRTADETQELS